MRCPGSRIEPWTFRGRYGELAIRCRGAGVLELRAGCDVVIYVTRALELPELLALTIETGGGFWSGSEKDLVGGEESLSRGPSRFLKEIR